MPAHLSDEKNSGVPVLLVVVVVVALTMKGPMKKMLARTENSAVLEYCVESEAIAEVEAVEALAALDAQNCELWPWTWKQIDQSLTLLQPRRHPPLTFIGGPHLAAQSDNERWLPRSERESGHRVCHFIISLTIRLITLKFDHPFRPGCALFPDGGDLAGSLR
jgi:hypothetical protein